MKTLILLLIVSFTLNSQPILDQGKFIPGQGQMKNIISKSLYPGFPSYSQFHLSKKFNLQKPINLNGYFYLPQEIIMYYATTAQKYQITYDAMGKWLTEYWQMLNNTVWVDDYRNTATYDANGYLVSVLGETWENNAWQNSYRGTYTNDIHGNVLTEYVEFWQNGAWGYSSRYTSTYDGSGNILTWTSENYNSGTWSYAYQYIYSYDQSGRLIEEMSQNWSGAWQYENKSLYSYNAGGQVQSETYQQYTNSQWTNTWQNNFSYDLSGNMITELVQRWINNAWTDYGRYTGTYDSHGGLLMNLYETYENNIWGNYSKSVYVNDNNGFAVQGDFFMWQNSSWVEAEGMLTIRYIFNSEYVRSGFYARKITVQYLVISGINENPQAPVNYSLAQNYPNPFNPSTVIHYSIPTTTHVTLKLFDVMGNEISTLVDVLQSPGDFDFNLSSQDLNLSSGVYFYQLRADDFSATNKMIFMK